MDSFGQEVRHGRAVHRTIRPVPVLRPEVAQEMLPRLAARLPDGERYLRRRCERGHRGTPQHSYVVGKEKGTAAMVHNCVPRAGGVGCGVTEAATVAEEAAVPPVAIAGGKAGDIHRIGGASVENLRLKPRGAALDIPGISVIKAPTAGAAAREIRTGLPRAKALHEQAKTVGTASEEGIRSAGFDIIPTPSTAIPNHHRIIHPDGVAGFNDTNLGRLAEVFGNTTGH